MGLHFSWLVNSNPIVSKESEADKTQKENFIFVIFVFFLFSNSPFGPLDQYSKHEIFSHLRNTNQPLRTCLTTTV